VEKGGEDTGGRGWAAGGQVSVVGVMLEMLAGGKVEGTDVIA